MKKLLLAVILLAAVAGIYFLLTRKSESPSPTTEKLIGQWKIDSIGTLSKDTNSLTAIILAAMVDSNFNKTQYQFREDGMVIKTVPGTDTVGTSRYHMQTDSLMIFYDHPTDTTGEKLRLHWSDAQHLQLISTDSTFILLLKKP